mmetsp:Transcript_27419/g.55159  ORF Transcript_27419/g.55159 Transcript_27419/m.55159 type:complete len:482 (-) Transcript_27419:198-1643(-)
MEIIVGYMKRRRFPQDLERKVKKFYRRYFAQRSAFDESSVLGELSSRLKNEVALFVVNDVIIKHALFQDLSLADLSIVTTRIRPMYYEVEESLVMPGDPVDDLHVINVGTLAEFDKADNLVRRLKHSDLFGEECLLVHSGDVAELPTWEVSITAIERCECLVVVASDLIEAFSLASPKSKGLETLMRNVQTIRTELKRKYEEKQLTYAYTPPTSASLHLGSNSLLSSKQTALMKSKIERLRSARSYHSVLGANTNTNHRGSTVVLKGMFGGDSKSPLKRGSGRSNSFSSGRSSSSPTNHGLEEATHSPSGGLGSMGSGGGGHGGISHEAATALKEAISQTNSKVDLLSAELQATRAAVDGSRADAAATRASLDRLASCVEQLVPRSSKADGDMGTLHSPPRSPIGDIPSSSKLSGSVESSPPSSPIGNIPFSTKRSGSGSWFEEETIRSSGIAETKESKLESISRGRNASLPPMNNGTWLT